MEKLDLQVIINEIKARGLTAYQISKDVPLSEDGINKILSGASENPRKSTLLLLHNYLFEKKEVNEKTPPKEARFEDIVAEKVSEILTPSLNSYTEEVIRAIGNLHIELNLLRQKMAKVEEMQKDCNKIQVETFDFIKHK